MFSAQDHLFMSRALELAHEGLYTTTPNPRVGCVIVKDGVVIGEGAHKKAGEPHAEIYALIEARAQVGADRLAGATLYVTLEPCQHFGRTPPCVVALIEARIGCVVASMPDPNPLVAGKGLEALRQAGIDVRCGLLHAQATELNLGFISRMTRGRPWVRSKIAASMDGKTALNNGVSQWITGAEARRDGHLWRARSCALLTGIGTVRADNPRLNVREVPSSRTPWRVVVDSTLEISPDAALFGTRADEVLIFTAHASPQRQQALLERGVNIIECPNEQGRVNLGVMLENLAARGVNELHVEAGARLNAALLQADYVDEMLLYFAPTILGVGRNMFDESSLIAPEKLDQLPRFRFTDMQSFGEDIRIIARKGPTCSPASFKA